jgi:sugar phosphate isomerase/epimerase
VPLSVSDRSAGYLAEFTEQREAAGVELWSLLIDDGDLNHPTESDAHRDWILGWIDTAATLGAKNVRVIGGKQPQTPESLARTIAQFRILGMEAYVRGVRVLTENWFPTLSTPGALCEVIDTLNGAIGLTFDFGNWNGPNKYERLTEIAHLADGCHAKCEFLEAMPATEDFVTCLEITRAAEFSGPYTLVYAESGDVWGSLEAQRKLIEPYL